MFLDVLPRSRAIVALTSIRYAPLVSEVPLLPAGTQQARIEVRVSRGVRFPISGSHRGAYGLNFIRVEQLSPIETSPRTRHTRIGSRDETRPRAV